MIHGPKALEGITVLDIAGSVAAGYCGKLFADHGADVVLIEPPGSGFATRELAPFVSGSKAPEASAMHSYLSTNKRSVVLDMKSPNGLKEFLSLARGKTLVIDSDGAGNRAVDPNQLAKGSPNCVLMSITWFGQDGPYRDYAGSEGVCQALSGRMYPLGPADGAPLIPGGYQAQIVCGLTAYVAALGQILGRELGNVSGFGHLDVSIYEANLCFTELGAIRGYNGDETPKRMGVNRLPPTYPIGVYPCKDGWLGVTALTPAQWKSFCALLELKGVADLPKYQTTLGRLEDADELEEMILDAVRERSAGELFHRGQGMRIPLAPGPTMEQLFDVDQYVQRRAFANVSHPDQGQFKAPATPFRLFRTPSVEGGRVSRLGEDTENVLGGVREAIS